MREGAPSAGEAGASRGAFAGRRCALGLALPAALVLAWAVLLAAREAPRWRFRWTWDVSDIIAFPGESPGTNAAKLEELVAAYLITGWEPLGDRWPRIEGGRLTVLGTWGDRRKAERCLHEVRAARAILATVDSRKYEISDEFLREIGVLPEEY